MKVLGTLLLAFMAFECVMAKAKVDETSDKLQILSDDHKDFFVESSGEDEYYYEDDDDYFGEEGSGDEEELEEHVAFGSQANEDEGIKVVLETEKSKTTTIKTNDFHFVETTEKNEELLYEYNNEYYEEEDYMDLDKIKDVEKEEEEEIEEIIVKTDKESDNSSSMFKLSYLYIMLASAFLSFCFAIVAFMVCKKSMLDKQDKKQQKLVPFIVSTDPRVINKKSPIVKSYQRVPTSTQEFLHSDFHASSSVKESPSQVPLLT